MPTCQQKGRPTEKNNLNTHAFNYHDAIICRYKETHAAAQPGLDLHDIQPCVEGEPKVHRRPLSRLHILAVARYVEKKGSNTIIYFFLHDIITLSKV
jgi:hypothetical protein